MKIKIKQILNNLQIRLHSSSIPENRWILNHIKYFPIGQILAKILFVKQPQFQNALHCTQPSHPAQNKVEFN